MLEIYKTVPIMNKLPLNIECVSAYGTNYYLNLVLITINLN